MKKAASFSYVAVVRINGGEIRAAMDRLFSSFRLPAKARSIGIKVNMADYRRRETGVCTDPLVLDALLGNIRSRYQGAHVFLFEHDATGVLADNIYRYLGLDRVARKYGADFVNLKYEKWVEKEIDGLHFRKVHVPGILLDADMIVNHPKLKTHGRSLITCGLKNMYGCFMIKNKVDYHEFLDEAIVDINLALKSDLVVVDGYIAVEGNRGPTQGFPKKLGVLIGGNDVVSVDCFAARLMGFGPGRVRHVRMAAEKGIGSTDYELMSELPESEIRGCKFQFSMFNYYLMETARRFFK